MVFHLLISDTYTAVHMPIGVYFFFFFLFSFFRWSLYPWSRNILLYHMEYWAVYMDVRMFWIYPGHVTTSRFGIHRETMVSAPILVIYWGRSQAHFTFVSQINQGSVHYMDNFVSFNTHTSALKVCHLSFFTFISSNIRIWYIWLCHDIVTMLCTHLRKCFPLINIVMFV